MNAKAKGTRGERDYRELMEAEGYEVYRSAASVGTFDLIGLKVSDKETKPIEVLAVQVKRYAERKGYGKARILKELVRWSGIAWVRAQLAERADGCPWEITEVGRPE